MNSPQLFDRRLLRQRRSRCMQEPRVQSFYDYIAKQLEQRLALFSKNFATGLIIGPLSLPLATVTLQADSIPNPASALLMDEEYLPFAQESFDVIVSFMGLHTINDLPSVLQQFYDALRPNGLLLAAFVGEESLHQLRHCFWEAELHQTQGVSPRVMPLLTLQDAGSLLQRAGFTLPVVDKDRLVMDFLHPQDLITFLRAADLTNVLHERNKNPLPRRLWDDVKRLYQHNYRTQQGSIAATFDIVYMTGLKK